LSSKPVVNPGFDLTPMEPTRLFDDFYCVGTIAVGSFIVDSKEGLIMIDTGWGEEDCSQFVTGMRKLGLNPSNIKLILISHEHLDHYGGVPFLKKNVCPDAKVAMSTIGWNYLQARPADSLGRPYSNPRPESIDMFLTDGQKIKLGNAVVQIVATPGHTGGCISFIIPVTDNGIPHVVGIMGGASPSNNWEMLFHFKASIEYFKRFAREARCDAGLAIHFRIYEAEMNAIRSRKPGQANPLVIGTEKFETVYLQQYLDKFQAAIRQMPPEVFPPAPPWIK
jgi:metallo-beta-lactamase class B